MIKCILYNFLKRYNQTVHILLIFLFLTNLSFFFDIPLLRQSLGFIYLSIIPGYVIISALKLDSNNYIDNAILSTGLSISFIMFFGLLINYLYPLFGYDKPLSKLSIIISYTIILLFMVLVVYFTENSHSSFQFFQYIWPNTIEMALLSVPVLFLLISVIGIYLMNTINNNILLMLFLFLIPIYSIFLVYYDYMPNRIYPSILFLFAISLVSLLGLRSYHLIGTDVHSEYYLFQQTLLNERWQILMNSTIDSCISISILPTVYLSILNTNLEYTFKILYPIFFSISPLIIYTISSKYIDNKFAFLASIFFMSQLTFLTATANPRSTLAILYFSLAVMVLTCHEFSEANRKILFIIFTISCIISHYSTSYIFFIIIFSLWFAMQIINGILLFLMKPLFLRGEFNNPIDCSATFSIDSLSRFHLTFGILLISLIAIFCWYSQITGAAFNSGIAFIARTIESFNDFFVMESRGEGVASAFGVGYTESLLPQKINFISSWLTIFFIGTGVITTAIGYKNKAAFACRNAKDSFKSLYNKFDIEIIVLSIICSVILMLSVSVPFILVGYSMDRIYCQMMAVLSLFFAIGGMKISDFIHVKKRYLVIFIVLVPYFLCNTGFVSQLYGIPASIALNSDGALYDQMYICDQEAFASKWLKSFMNNEEQIYSDLYGICRLISQGSIYIQTNKNRIDELIEKNASLNNGYIYQRNHLIANGTFPSKVSKSDNLYNYLISKGNLIYSNSGSSITFYN